MARREPEEMEVPPLAFRCERVACRDETDASQRGNPRRDLVGHCAEYAGRNSVGQIAGDWQHRERDHVMLCDVGFPDDAPNAVAAKVTSAAAAIVRLRARDQCLEARSRSRKIALPSA